MELDLAEGADMVMVKPAMSYLDILADVAAMSPVPVAAYQISGEYSMIEAAAANGWIDRRAAITESVLGIRRAGANMVLTYWAERARRLAEGNPMNTAPESADAPARIPYPPRRWGPTASSWA